MDNRTVDPIIERIVSDADLPTERERSDLRRELRAHFEDAVRSGASEAEALARFGSVHDVSSGFRRVYRTQGLFESPASLTRGLLQDFRFGVRLLRRNPGFSTIALLCLAVGIGANTAVLSWVEGVMLRPYPLVHDEDSLFVIAGTAPEASKGTDISWPDFKDFERSATMIDAFIGDRITSMAIGLPNQKAERAAGSIVSANYFDALGVEPLLGRGFEPHEEIGRNAHPVVVISYQFWQRHFGNDPRAVGTTIRLNGVPHTIVGVAPEGFYGTFVGYEFQLWVPASQEDVFDPGGYKLEDRSARWIEGFARVKRGVSRAQAQKELSAIADRLQIAYPATNRGRGVMLKPLWQSPFNPMDALVPTLTIALVGVVAVLLIACANVGNLLLLKSIARRRELTTRVAVGAGRMRIVRQMLSEAIILTAIAAVCGVIAAYWGRGALVFLFPPRGATPLRLPADLDWRVLVASVGVALIATLLSGLIPALLASKVDLVAGLKTDSAGAAGGRGRANVRAALVVIQVALSFVLLVGAGLVVESLHHMHTSSPGFDADRVLSTYVDTAAAGYDRTRANAFQDRLIERVEAIPGVESAVFVGGMPFAYAGGGTAPIDVDGYQTQPDDAPTVDYSEVGPGYFKTLGIPVVDGREFTRDDIETSDAVAIVNGPMAARYWKERNPVGTRLIIRGRPVRVVGVVKASKYRDLVEAPQPFFYIPLRQSPARGQSLLIRSTLPPGAISRALGRDVTALDQTLTAGQVMTMREQINRMDQSVGMAVRLLTGFGVVALLLATVGIYGVMSFKVTESARELALRLALGADRSSVLRKVLTRGLVLTGGGIACGAVTALALTRLLGRLLFDVSPRDPVTFGVALVTMGTAAIAACALPAWRATRTDPIVALRG